MLTKEQQKRINAMTAEEFRREIRKSELETDIPLDDWRQNSPMSLDRQRNARQATFAPNLDAYDPSMTNEVLQEHIKRFSADYPQVAGNKANGETITRWLVEHRVPSTYNNLKQAFLELATTDLHINLAALGIEGYGGKIRGAAVTALPTAILDKVLRRYQPPDPNANKKADDFYREHPEIHDPRIAAAREQARIAAMRRQVDTFKASIPGYDPTEDNRELLVQWHLDHDIADLSVPSLTQAFNELVAAGKIQPDTSRDAQSGATRLVDFKAKPKGFRGPQVDASAAPARKRTLREVVNSLTSAQLQERVANDRKFRAAVDFGDLSAEIED